MMNQRGIEERRMRERKKEGKKEGTEGSTAGWQRSEGAKKRRE